MSSKLTGKIEKGFIELYDKHADAIFRYCYYRVYNREHAKELMQEAFTKSWHYLSQGKEIKDLKAFVYKTATNLIIDEKRRKRQSLSLEELSENGFEVEDKTDEFEQININYEANNVKVLLEQMEPDYKEVIVLRYINDLYPKEIAEILGENTNVISVRLNRAMRRLRELLRANKMG